MKCIVTAGPTYEELDEVRRMTNFSTGALGTELANFLAARGHTVVLLRGYYSTCQTRPKMKGVQVFTTTADLRARLRNLRSEKIEAVFHAAAVSDFSFGRIWRRGSGGRLSEVKARKVSTKNGVLLAELRPTPKIIGRLRGWFPRACVVGWKYEVDGDRAQTIQLAERQLAENKTNGCVVNGPAYGKGFGLVQPAPGCQHLGDKRELFKALLEFSRG